MNDIFDDLDLEGTKKPEKSKVKYETNIEQPENKTMVSEDQINSFMDKSVVKKSVKFV